MFSKISISGAINGIIIISVLVILFHLSVITGIVPYDLVWGGKLKSIQDMYVFEIISIAINLLIIWLVSVKKTQFKQHKKSTLSTVLLYFFAFLFFLNTLGNLLAEKSIETMIFTPITLVLALLFLRIAIHKPQEEQ